MCSRLLVLLCACGDGVVRPDFEVPVQTLNCRVGMASVTPTPKTRATIVWNGPEHAVVQDLGPAYDVGVSFTLTLDALPPDGAVDGCGPQCEYASGDLVIYEDFNENHTLDLVEWNAKSAPDKVLGVLKGYALIYQRGSGSTAFGGAPQGFSWWAGVDSFVPLSAIVDIALSGSAAQQVLMCANAPAADARTAVENPRVHDVYPDFDTAEDVVCDESGGSWHATVFKDVRSACLPEGIRLPAFSNAVWTPDDTTPPPDDWPCPVTE